MIGHEAVGEPASLILFKRPDRKMITVVVIGCLLL
jgi:hypothetical protein